MPTVCVSCVLPREPAVETGQCFRADKCRETECGKLSAANDVGQVLKDDFEFGFCVGFGATIIGGQFDWDVKSYPLTLFFAYLRSPNEQDDQIALPLG